MEFFTIGSYFTKLNIRLLLIILILVIGFVIAYVLSAHESERLQWLSLTQTIAFIAVDWLVAFIYYLKKIKSIAKDQGLGVKLTKFFYLTIVRYMLLAGACIFLLYGFFVTKDDRLTALFVANLLLMGFLWPTSKKVSNDLKLKGDEREMVYFKKDQL
jgi:hypothetical protein